MWLYGGVECGGVWYGIVGYGDVRYGGMGYGGAGYASVRSAGVKYGGVMVWDMGVCSMVVCDFIAWYGGVGMAVCVLVVYGVVVCVGMVVWGYGGVWYGGVVYGGVVCWCGGTVVWLCVVRRMVVRYVVCSIAARGTRCALSWYAVL